MRKTNSSQCLNSVTEHPKELIHFEDGMGRRHFLANTLHVAAAFGAIELFGSLFELSPAAAQVQRIPGQDESTLRSTYTGVVFSEDHKSITCTGKGKDCLIARLVNAKRLSSFHGAELEKYTNRINAIASEIASTNKDPKRRVCFIITPHAPFLAWTTQVTPDRTAKKGIAEKGITQSDDPTKFYQLLGISRAIESYRQRPTRNWIMDATHFICRKGGETQSVGRLLNADRLSSIHDAELQARTNQINALFSECEKGKKNPRHQLSLMVTPKGLFLAWSEDDDTKSPLPKGAITAESEPEKIYQALGI